MNLSGKGQSVLARMKEATQERHKKGTECYGPGRRIVQKEEDLRDHLVALLDGRQAHANFDDVIHNIPADLRGVCHPEVAHTAWGVLEHLRIAQWDILEFSRDPSHESPQFPEGYWPVGESPPDSDSWERSMRAFKSDLGAFQNLVADPSTDLFAEIPWGTGQTVLREALLVADHNSYHLGELVTLRRLLGIWPNNAGA